MSLYVAKNGQTFGPHEVEELAAFLRRGDFAPEDFCWQDGWGEWRPISSVIPSDAPPPAPSIQAAPPPAASPPPPVRSTQIPDDIEIAGTLNLPGDRTVGCRVEGEIRCPSTLTIAKEANIKARLEARTVVIFGRVEGDVHAADRAILKSSSVLHGDIHAPRVLVEEGATFNGKSHVGSSKPDAATSSARSGAAAASPARPA